MAPIVDYTIPTSSEDNSDFFCVPSIKFHVARQRTLQGKNWVEEHNQLKSQGNRMIVIPEFVEVLKYTKDNEREVYDDITQIRNPWRAEWFDAYFEQRQDGMYVLTANKTKAEKLDEGTLMQDKRISLDSWIENPTKQGLPKSDVEGGDLYYWSPIDKRVVRFDANGGRASLICGGAPSGWISNLGVRAVRHE